MVTIIVKLALGERRTLQWKLVWRRMVVSLGPVKLSLTLAVVLWDVGLLLTFLRKTRLFLAQKKKNK